MILTNTPRWSPLPYVGACLVTLLTFFPEATAGPQEKMLETASSPPVPQQRTLRMATLAPQGSDWADAAREAAHRIQEETAGRVALRWFLGAAMGDEATMLARIRQGSLDGGVLSMVGLTRAVPPMAFLSLPFLFHSLEEAREISERFAPVFQERLLEEDMYLLGGFSLGFGRLFTTQEARTLQQLTALSTWVWKGDPLGETIFRALGFTNLVPLEMTDVLPALNYGLLDTISGTCYTISVFQWFPHARYMVPLNWGYTFGGVVVRREAFSMLSASDQDLVRGVFSELLLRLEVESMRKEEEAGRILASVEGMQEIRLSRDELSLLEARAGNVYKTVAERLQARDLLQSILQALDALRGASSKPPPDTHREEGGRSGPKPDGTISGNAAPAAWLPFRREGSDG